MKAFLIDNPIQTLKLLFTNRNLLWELAKRNLRDKYHGQILGFFWFFFQPIVFLFIYTLIFGFVVASRQQSQGFSLGVNYVYILSGLIPWLTFIDVMGKTSSALRSNTSLIKQVIFPIEILPYVFLVVSLLQQVVVYALFFTILLFSGYEFKMQFLLFPIFVFFQIVALSGIAMMFSVLSVFIRDLSEIIGVFSSIMIYSTPIFYKPDNLPAYFKEVVLFNPISQPVLCFQHAFVSEHELHLVSVFIYITGALALFVVGVNLFKKLKPILGNFL